MFVCRLSSPLSQPIFKWFLAVHFPKSVLDKLVKVVKAAKNANTVVRIYHFEIFTNCVASLSAMKKFVEVRSATAKANTAEIFATIQFNAILKMVEKNNMFVAITISMPLLSTVDLSP